MSTAPDISERIPLLIGGGLGFGTPGDPSLWDVTFNGLGFNLKPSVQTPYQRGTEQQRKQQIDTSEDAGEQSLSSWWVRSQDSWDMGAGIRWYEPGGVRETANRFEDSQGINVWTQGEMSLLHSVSAAGGTEATDVFVSGLMVGDDSGYVKAFGTTVTWVPPTGSPVSGTLPGTGATQPASAGGHVWIGHDGGVSKFDASTGTVTTPYTCTGVTRAWWVKARLVVALGPALYELTPTGSGALSGLTALYTHPDADWTWTDVTETGAAVLAAGYSANDSAIFRFTLELDEANLPVLSGGSQVAKMPPTERVTCMGTYLGSYVVLGTSSGIRVGFAADDGLVEYGPLTVELASPAQDVTFRDRFAYVAVTNAMPDGTSGVVRIDLSAQIGEENRFAWAWDVSAGVVGTNTSVALIGSRVVCAVARCIYVESETDYVDEGWLRTGGVRFRTVEPKAFRLARVVTRLNGGSVGLVAITPDGVERRVVEFAPSFQADADVAIQAPGLTHQYLDFKVTLRPSDAGESPVVSGLVIKAAPAAGRVRLFQFPLSVQDFERNRHGELEGGPGWGYMRLKALEALEETGKPVQVIDNRTGESITGQIDTVDFSSASPPDGSENGFGGIAMVVVRRL